MVVMIAKEHEFTNTAGLYLKIVKMVTFLLCLSQ